MTAYNIEFFNYRGEFRSHTTVNDVPVKFDYLNIEAVDIILLNVDVKVNDFIRITRNELEHVGVVSSVTNQSATQIKVSFKSFLTLFDVEIPFRTAWQGDSNHVLESDVASIINEFYSLRVGAASTATYATAETTQLASYGFNFKADTEGSGYLIINFYENILKRAFEKYNMVVSINFSSDSYNTHYFSFAVKKITEPIRTIEADLPNVFEKLITVKQTDSTFNCLRVYHGEHIYRVRTYYLAADGTYSRLIENAQYPLSIKSVSALPETDGETERTFEEVADSTAAEQFGGINYNNLVELHVLNDDSLIKPSALKIGQEVDVITKGQIIRSVFSGYEIGKTTKLSFGLLRLELTKLLKGGH